MGKWPFPWLRCAFLGVVVLYFTGHLRVHVEEWWRLATERLRDPRWHLTRSAGATLQLQNHSGNSRFKRDAFGSANARNASGNASGSADARNASARPNLLLLFPDQWRHDWDGLTTVSGGQELPLRAPTMKRLAAQGVRFTQAYVPSPLCAPSRACLASGREYDSTGVPNKSFDFPLGSTTFYALLRDAGYHTMTVGKDDLTQGTRLGEENGGHPRCSYCKRGDGLYRQSELGFDDGLRYAGKKQVVGTGSAWDMYGRFLRSKTAVSLDGVKQNAWQAHRQCFQDAKHRPSKQGAACDNQTFTRQFYEDDYTAMNAIKLLRRRPKDKPWFLQVNFPGPHDPFLVTGEMRDSVSDGRVWPEAVDDHRGRNQTTPGGSCKPLSGPSGARTRCNYAAEVENLDSLFSKILYEVERQGELKRTIIFVSSDHGEALGDHSGITKAKPWQGVVSVPLLVVGAEHAGPSIQPGLEVDKPVATLDLAGTFLDFAGVEPAPNMTAISLRPFLTGEDGKGYRSFVSSGYERFRVVVKAFEGATYKYICCRGKCPAAPSTAPPRNHHGWTEMLIHVEADPFEMHDLSRQLPTITSQMRDLLPTHAYRGWDFAKGCSAM